MRLLAHWRNFYDNRAITKPKAINSKLWLHGNGAIDKAVYYIHGDSLGQWLGE